MNHKDKALRAAFKAFRRMRNGAIFGYKSCDLLANMCALALPMKYRFTRQELNELDKDTFPMESQP